MLEQLRGPSSIDDLLDQLRQQPRPATCEHQIDSKADLAEYQRHDRGNEGCNHVTELHDRPQHRIESPGKPVDEMEDVSFQRAHLMPANRKRREHQQHHRDHEPHGMSGPAGEDEATAGRSQGHPPSGHAHAGAQDTRSQPPAPGGLNQWDYCVPASDGGRQAFRRRDRETRVKRGVAVALALSLVTSACNSQSSPSRVDRVRDRIRSGRGSTRDRSP